MGKPFNKQREDALEMWTAFIGGESPQDIAKRMKLRTHSVRGTLEAVRTAQPGSRYYGIKEEGTNGMSDI